MFGKPSIPSESVSPANHSSDTLLARRASSGDRSAEELLFRQLKTAVHATLFRMLGSNSHMEDLIHEAFIGVFRALPSYRGETKLAIWADRIAVRVAFRHLRQASSSKTGDEPAEATPSLRLVSADDTAGHRRGLARLYAHLRELEPDYQIAFALSELDGRPTEELAELLGISLVAARSRISRARRKLWEAAREDDVLARYLDAEAVQPE